MNAVFEKFMDRWENDSPPHGRHRFLMDELREVIKPELERLEKRNEALELKQHSDSQLITALEASRYPVESAVIERDMARSLLSEAKKEQADLVEKIKYLEMEKSVLDESVVELEQKQYDNDQVIGALKAEREVLEANIGALEDSRDSARSERDKAVKMLDDAEVEVQMFRETVQELERRVASGKEEILSLHEEIDRLHIRLQKEESPSESESVFIPCTCDEWKQHFQFWTLEGLAGYSKNAKWTRCPFCESDKPLWRDKKHVKTKQWVNVYADGEGFLCTGCYGTIEEAHKSADGLDYPCVAAVQVLIEFDVEE